MPGYMRGCPDRCQAVPYADARSVRDDATGERPAEELGQGRRDALPVTVELHEALGDD